MLNYHHVSTLLSASCMLDLCAVLVTPEISPLGINKVSINQSFKVANELAACGCWGGCDLVG